LHTPISTTWELLGETACAPSLVAQDCDYKQPKFELVISCSYLHTMVDPLSQYPYILSYFSEDEMDTTGEVDQNNF